MHFYHYYCYYYKIYITAIIFNFVLLTFFFSIGSPILIPKKTKKSIQPTAMVNSNNAIDSKKIYDESYDMDAAVVTRKLNAMDAIIRSNSRGIIKYSLPQHEQDLCSRKGGICFNSLDEKNNNAITYQSPTCNLNAGAVRPSYCISHMLDLLSVVTARLEQTQIMHWLHQGTLLGAVRDGQIIPWTNDVDLAFFEKDLEAVEEALSALRPMGIVFVVHKTEPHGIPWIVVSGNILGAHLDLAGFRIYDTEHPDPLNNKDTDSLHKHSTFVGQCIKSMHKCKDREKGVGYVRARDILPLKYLTFMGRDFLIPNNETSYLTKYYGSTWHIIDREGKGDWHDEEDEVHVMEDSGDVNHPINLRALRLNSPRVYVDVVGDLVHFGHVNLFKQARRWGASLIVGVHNDSTVSSYKRRPIMNMEERINAIKDFSMVDMVIPNAPLKVSKAYLKYHQISIVVHGDDTPMDTLQLMYGDAMELGIFKTVPYTKGISTSDIIQRIVERSKLNDDYNRLSKKTT